jgi:hypothetical protein
MKDAPFCRHVPPKRSKRSAKKGSGPLAAETDNLVYGRTNNPFNVERTTGSWDRNSLLSIESWELLPKRRM